MQTTLYYSTIFSDHAEMHDIKKFIPAYKEQCINK